MIGAIFITSYFLSIGYNTIKLHKIRRETIKKCKEKLEEVGYKVNLEKLKSILEYTSTETVDDIGYGMLAYIPFASYWISYKIAKGQIAKEYNRISNNVLSYRIQKQLTNADIISKPRSIEYHSKLPGCMVDSFHERYSPSSSFTTGMERLIDGLPVTELITMSEVDSELDANVKTKILKK